jgi:TIR domain
MAIGRSEFPGSIKIIDQQHHDVLMFRDGALPMASLRTFKGFFSYARYDAETDPLLTKALTDSLEQRVNAKLANARFAIWRDEQGIRTGERWGDKIEAELLTADILIVLLTPRWIESDYCRKEYHIFDEVEGSRAAGDYVVPILARRIDQQEQHFTRDQREIWTLITERQYFKSITTDFLRLGPAKRTLVIDQIADDIAGMIDRLRTLPTIPVPPAPHRFARRGNHPSEFSGKAENYAVVDFLRSCEVLVDRAKDGRDLGIYAQADFVERLFIKTRSAYVEFGVSRAYLTVDGAPRQLQKVDELRGNNMGRAAYVTLHEIPEGLSIVMTAEPGRALADLALPPTEGNYWSHIATATSKVRTEQLRAALRVSFSSHGLQIANERSPPLSPALKRKIRAIIDVTIKKEHEKERKRLGQDGQVSRSVLIRERASE